MVDVVHGRLPMFARGVAVTTLEAAYQYIDRTLNPDGIADLGRDGLAVIMAGFADDQRRRLLTDPPEQEERRHDRD